MFEFVEANQAQFPAAVCCRVLGVSTSGYYDWRTRPPSSRALADEVLSEEIRLVHEQSRQTYGYRRVRAELSDGRGHVVGRHRVARLMRNAGIAGVTRRRFCRTTRRDDRARPAPDLLSRDFTATAPDQRWVADITYVPTWSGFLFLAVVVDVFSRRVVGWSMSANQRTELVTNALRMAVQRRRPIDVVVHHSDQGCQGSTRATTSPRRVEPPASSARWARSVTATTTRWPRASSPHSNVSYLIGVASRHTLKRAWPSSNSSKASTIHAVGIHHLGIYHLSHSSVTLRR